MPHPCHAPGLAAPPFALVLAAALLGLALPAAAPPPRSAVTVDDGRLARATSPRPARRTTPGPPGPGGTIAFVDPGATIDRRRPRLHPGLRARGTLPVGADPALGISLGDGDDRVNVNVTKPGLIGGDAGNDELTGGAGDEGLWGGDGDDALDGGGGADLMSGQDGTDTALYATASHPSPWISRRSRSARRARRASATPSPRTSSA